MVRYIHPWINRAQAFKKFSQDQKLYERREISSSYAMCYACVYIRDLKKQEAFFF
jgi:hypothetical protein